MYTRFKSQKAGIKHGLNQIATTARSRIVAPTPTDVKTKLETPIVINESKVDPLSLSSSSTSSLSSNLITLNSPTETTLPIFSNDLITISAPTTNSNTTSNTSITTSKSNKKLSKREETEQEPLDVNCISYVKTMWEKYSSEIGTQNGPLKYEQDASQCTHLNGFVPLDMESWWAERSISCMINEKSNKSTTSSSNSIDLTSSSSRSLTPPMSYSSSSSSSSSISPILTSLDSQFSLIVDTNNNNDRKQLNSINYKLATAKPITHAALHNYNNFQLCFS